MLDGLVLTVKFCASVKVNLVLAGIDYAGYAMARSVTYARLTCTRLSLDVAELKL